jgi:protocatechuate 3,4-dioxygenase beta subunit
VLPFRVLALSVLLTVLTGCSTAFNTPTTSSVPHAGAALAGAVHGGQQPITGSHIYLFAAGTTGYGSAPTSLLNTSLADVSTDTNGNGYVITDASGNWTISNDYTCPTPSSLVYL